MPKISLIAPTLAHQSQILSLAKAFDDKGLVLHGASLSLFDRYEDWLDFAHAPAGTPAPNEAFFKVADATFLGVDELGRVLGIINVRYELNDFLKAQGGNIGYSTHPDHWGQSIASQMLKLALTHCQEKGLTQVLITCDDTNLASAKVIENQGGILADKLSVNDKITRRYWIQF
ncbi:MULTISPECIES: GNAT family N-acetyltransferase [Moraxella]|uniref:Acetyltransferase n=1 Tax=Moraxella catarrhalis TaxID=480 RepID=A0A198UG53_MORCA|nr:GNAT family N-acetyltransferase [Moraxella catarrhalis]OAU95401.1 Acetyltransferase [Moraxella catarrhalis]OAU98218.1 Acetyltransferase [Moraxella catarrhalis]OAV01933.1 Acetyltransferase [Moraxella catarrhalis]OAV02769.1 Acetyltransferase [Moraxella catarrhalis]STY82151.1 Predicted acetyltransferase [Moraxella catarrhalis]